METNDVKYGHLLEISDLSVKFRTFEGKVSALDRVSLTLDEGEILGIIGESGSGKSTIASSIMGLLANNAEVSGSIKYMGQELLQAYDSTVKKRNQKKAEIMVERRLSVIRWQEISMVFQGSMNAFNPVKTIRRQIHEVFEVHGTFDDLSKFTESDYINEKVLLARARKEAEDRVKAGDEKDLETLQNEIFQKEVSDLKERLKYMSPRQKRELLERNVIESSCLVSGFNISFLDSFPHELSGGMKQRGIIAMALALRPKIVIADEPTTGLDVITQAKIIKELRKLRDQKIIRSMIVISHDVGVISQMANMVAVMYAGRLMEYGSPYQVFSRQRNPYTYALLKSYPSIESTRERIFGIPGSVPDLLHPPEGCYFASRCFMADSACFTRKPPLRDIEPGHYSQCFFDNISVERYGDFNRNQVRVDSMNLHIDGSFSEDLVEITGLKKYFSVHSSLSTNLFGGANKPVVHAVDDVNLTIGRGKIIGVVGESGSGKTTLGRLIVNAIDPTAGSIKFRLHSAGSDSSGEQFVDITKISKKSYVYNLFRKEAQLIFQDPYDSINPKMNVLDIVSEPLKIQQSDIAKRKISGDSHAHEKYGGARNEMERQVLEALDISNLRPPENYLERYPHELSGGERQRVTIARVITLDPMLIVADEPISMLDVSIRANIMNIFLNLREKYGISIIYISHDIASARYISDYLLIMYLGQVVEYGPTEEVIENPAHPYTKALISSVPSIDPNWAKKKTDIIGEIGNSINPPKGCRFYQRCIFRQNICKREDPPVLQVGERTYRCHFSQEQLVTSVEV